LQEVPLHREGGRLALLLRLHSEDFREGIVRLPLPMIPSGGKSHAEDRYSELLVSLLILFLLLVCLSLCLSTGVVLSEGESTSHDNRVNSFY